jgi:hypothetical protein
MLDIRSLYSAESRRHAIPDPPTSSSGTKLK